MEELYINELLFPSKKLPQKLRNKYIAEGHRRISWPLYNIVLSIIGTTFLLKGPYSRSGNGYKIFVASIIAIITIILNSALLSFTINYRYLSPLIYINIFITISLCTLYITGHLDKIKLVKQQ
jgi:lipopolysaccharide export system permease protein